MYRRVKIFRTLFKLKIMNGSRRWYSSQKRDYKEVSFKAPWGQISGKWWEPYDTRPILCLHGWQDNCGTFDRLIPMLNSNVGFLAIDLPGHGYSSWLPMGAVYNFRYYLATIKTIMVTLNWTKVSLMGHSMGGIMCFLFTIMFNKDVDFLICLDGLKPAINRNRLESFGRSISQYFKYHDQAVGHSEPPSYVIKDIIEKICAPNSNSVLPEYARNLFQRNIAPSKLNTDKFYFTRDPRIKSSDLSGFSQDELLHYTEKITIPIFITKSSTSFESKENFYSVVDILKRTSKDCEFHYVEGTHHQHLNNPENINELLNDFIRRHTTEDRSIGGIWDELIVDRKEPQLLCNY